MSGITNVNSTKSTILSINLNIQSETFKLVTVLCAVIFVVAVVFFSALRLRFRQIYSPRLLLIENKFFALTNLSKTFFAWILPALKSTDEDIFTHAGIDALVYTRFLKLVLKLSLFTLPYGFIVLLPINVNGGNHLKDGLDKMSMSNVTKNSKTIWAHFVAVWLYTLATLYLTYNEWKVYIKYRQKYLKKGAGNQFAVLVTDIPKMMTEHHLLKEELDQLFPNKISSIYIINDLTQWERLIKKHDSVVLKYEKAKFQAENNNPQHVSKSLCGEKVDALEEYEKQLDLIQEQLLEEKNRGDVKLLSCALIFFKSLKARTAALQGVWTTDPLAFHVAPAPEPEEMMWDNLKISFSLRKIRMVIGVVIVFFLVIFWTAPILFISSLTKLEALSKELKWLNDFKNGASDMVLSFIQGVVPVLLVALFNLLLPYILFLVAKFQGHSSKSNMAMMVFQCLFVFQTFNTFFIYIISGSVFSKLSQIIQNPIQLPNLLAKSLPSQSGFFINYLALTSFVGLAVELTRIVPLILTTLKLKCFAKTQRERLEAWKPRRAEYEVMFSQGLLFFLIGISYSILSPIIIPFFVFYYAFGYVVWVYQLLHVYIADWEHGGKFWPQVFFRILVSILVFQLLMIGVFFLKQMWYAATMTVPLVVLTVIYWWFMSTQYQKQGDFLVLSEAVSTQYAERTFLDETRKRYIRDSSLPDEFELSTDNKLTSLNDYIPIGPVENGSTSNP